MSRAAPSIGRLEEYIGSFYEDELDKKIKSCKDILLLFQDFANL